VSVFAFKPAVGMYKHLHTYLPVKWPITNV